MSDNALEHTASAWQQAMPVIRYAVGATIIQAVATGSGYTLSFVTPVLALGFLAPGAAPLTFKQGLGLITLLLAGSIIAVIFSKFFIDYPLAFIPLLGITLFHLFYSARINRVFKIWLLVSLLLIPMFFIVSGKIATLIALNLVKNAAIAIVMVWFVFFLFPHREASTASNKSEGQTLPSPVRFANALKITIVLMPLVTAFYIFQWSGAITALIISAILSLNPETANFKTGKFMILANLAGGIAAILAFNLFVIVPEFIYLILITLLIGLILGQRLFSGRPAASLYGSAFSTFLLILGSVTTSEDGEAGAKVWSRILQISAAVVYVVLAFSVVNAFFSSKLSAADDQD